VLAIATQWVGVVGALGGVIVTGLIALATAGLSHRWERAAARDERTLGAREARATLIRDAYTRWVVAVNAIKMATATYLVTHAGSDVVTAYKAVLDANRQEVASLETAEAELSIVSSEHVRKLVSNASASLGTLVEADATSAVARNAASDSAQEALTDAIRQELAELLA
jgi:hypothetical protein